MPSGFNGEKDEKIIAPILFAMYNTFEF